VRIRGSVHKYGADVNTDVIIPARYLNVFDPDELAQHCMEDIDSDFVNRVQPGDIIVADTNFGCGSSREHAPLAIKAAGVGCVIAKSFARIFYRNALNIGLPILECEKAAETAESGDTIEVELSTGEITNVTRGLSFRAEPFPAFMLELIEAGGLIEYTRRKIAAGGSPK
jgi:3-isopropylmalate/(R)-2-methylmalate dehydratase small subunit